VKRFKTFILCVSMLALLAAGCSKTDSVLGPNGILGGNQVTFQISQRNGINGGVEFMFKPSVDVKISRVVSIYQPENYTDTLNYTNTNFVYSKDETYIIQEYIGVVQGQQWNFNFTGQIPGQNNANYNVTANYTVQ